MEPIRISSPADVISYMGHSLGYWPQESLVCVALDGKALGPTLRVNLPGSTDFIETYTERVAHAVGIDHDATAVLVALFTHKPWNKGNPKPFASMIGDLRAASRLQGYSSTMCGSSAPSPSPRTTAPTPPRAARKPR